MSKNKLTTNTISLFLGILITTSTIFSALVIILPFNNVFAEQIHNTETFQASPIKDKKQFCETGQFKGFYVSSAEFCNLEIPSGPQGPSGITELNDTNTYQVTTEEIVNNFTSSTSGQASCNSGDFVINGGFTITGTSPSPAGVTLFENTNRPFYTPFISGWEVYIFPTSPDDVVIYLVHATCFDNSPSTSLATASTASPVQQQREDSPIITQAIDNSPELTTLEKQREDSPIISQAKGDSPALTATEKITKLKTQWLNQLQ